MNVVIFTLLMFSFFPLTIQIRSYVTNFPRMPVQVKDQDELRQLLDSLKSSDVISVQVLGLDITSTVVTNRVM